jgi:hypothetical protein
MTTLRTSLRRVPGVNEHNRDTEALCFVHQEVLELAECPSRHHAIELLGSSGPAPNALKVLKNYDGAFILGGGINYLATDLVIDVAHPVRFFATAAHTIPSVVSLIPASEICEMLSAVTDLFAVEEFNPIRVCNRRDSNDAQINTNEHVFAVTDGRCFNFVANREGNIPITILLVDASISINGGHQVPILSRDTKGEPNITPLGAGRASYYVAAFVVDDLIRSNPQPNALRFTGLGKGSCLLVPRFTQRMIRSDHGHRLINDHTSIIRRKAEKFSDITIAAFVYLPTASDVLFFSIVEAVLHSVRECLRHGFKPKSLAISRRRYFDHKTLYPSHNTIMQYGVEVGQPYTNDGQCGRIHLVYGLRFLGPSSLRVRSAFVFVAACKPAVRLLNGAADSAS